MKWSFSLRKTGLLMSAEGFCVFVAYCVKKDTFCKNWNFFLEKCTSCMERDFSKNALFFYKKIFFGQSFRPLALNGTVTARCDFLFQMLLIVLNETFCA